MNHNKDDKPTLSERFFAAIFSGFAAGVTYAVWVFFNAYRWGIEQIQTLQSMGTYLGHHQPAATFAKDFRYPAGAVLHRIRDLHVEPVLKLDQRHPHRHQHSG